MGERKEKGDLKEEENWMIEQGWSSKRQEVDVKSLDLKSNRMGVSEEKVQLQDKARAQQKKVGKGRPVRGYHQNRGQQL